MEESDAIAMFAALAHATRLALFRLLVRAGGDGMIAGALAERLAVAPSTLSHHLAALERCGLIAQRRDSRTIVYSMAPDAVRGLTRFLTEDCCDGRPDLCGLPAR